MITNKELIRDTKKIVNYCRRLLLATSMVIDVLRRRKLSAQESCYYQEKIRNSSLNLFFCVPEFKSKHDLRAALVSVRSEHRAMIKRQENLSAIEDFSEILLGGRGRSAEDERDSFESRHGIPFHALLEELWRGDGDDVQILSSALNSALFVLGRGKQLSAAGTANIKESSVRVQVCVRDEAAARAAAKIIIAMHKLVTWILTEPPVADIVT